MTKETRMETTPIAETNCSRIGLGTWRSAAGCGGTDEAESVRTIHAALDRGITLIDTAPVYGSGGRRKSSASIADGGRRSHAFVATKAALDWKDEKPFRNASRTRISRDRRFIARLRTDVIDLYQSIGQIRTAH